MDEGRVKGGRTERMNMGEWEDAKRWEEQVHSDPDPPPGNTEQAATAGLLSAAGPEQRMKRYRTQIWAKAAAPVWQLNVQKKKTIKLCQIQVFFFANYKSLLGLCKSWQVHSVLALSLSTLSSWGGRWEHLGDFSQNTQGQMRPWASC